MSYPRISLYVLDTGPLITLAAADSLDDLPLEEQQRIQSADAVFERAMAAGRTPSRVGKFADHDPAIRDAVRETLMAARKRKAPPNQ